MIREPAVIDLAEYCRAPQKLSRREKKTLRFIERVIERACEGVPGRECLTDIPCDEYVEGIVCRGKISVLRAQVPEMIRYHCTVCGRRGTVTNWKGIVPLSVPDDEPPRPGREYEIVELVLSQAEFNSISVISGLDPVSFWIVRGAVKCERGILLYGMIREISDLLRVVLREITLSSDKTVNDIYRAVSDKIRTLIE
jgi:hypothetical protein